VLGSIVENCPVGDAIRRNKASEVHKFGLRLMPELYDSLHPTTCKRALQAPKKMADDLESAIQTSGLQLADDALPRASDLLEQAFQKRGARFGNARLVRTMFERATVPLSDRLALDFDITRQELTTIHAEDIELPREIADALGNI